MWFGAGTALFGLWLRAWLGDSALTLGRSGGALYSLWFAWASVLHVDLFKRERQGGSHEKATRVSVLIRRDPSSGPLIKKGLQKQPLSNAAFHCSAKLSDGKARVLIVFIAEEKQDTKTIQGRKINTLAALTEGLTSMHGTHMINREDQVLQAAL